MSTVDEYKAAMNELAAASKAYAPMHAALRQVGSAIGYDGNGYMEFLRVNFGLNSDPHQRATFDPKNRVDFKKWPPADEITAAGKRLAGAYNAAHAIYAALPPDDREYIKSPPYNVDLKL